MPNPIVKDCKKPAQLFLACPLHTIMTTVCCMLLAVQTGTWNLFVLDASHNNLNSPLPGLWASKAPALKDLRLSYNNFTVSLVKCTASSHPSLYCGSASTV